jgi:alpha-mannosidase
MFQLTFSGSRKPEVQPRPALKGDFRAVGNAEPSGPQQFTRREFVGALVAASLAPPLSSQAPSTAPREVYLVPNFHPASCGWLTTFSRERIYCANSYLNHLDRVRDDPNYSFVLSEVNNIIAIMEFQRARIPELTQRIAEKRVEFVNAYFLESAINLSGGEALVRLGVEGLRWYKQVFGLQPRFSWNIDVCGTHDQMPQIATGLGLEALIYTRGNATGKTLFWSEAPDGTRILTISPGHYSEAGAVFSSKEPLSHPQLDELESFFARKEAITPENAPILVLAGADDYALAPLCRQYPSLFLQQWAESAPHRQLQFATLSKYVDAILPGIQSRRIQIPVFRGGTAYDFDAFWIENPRVKTLYRQTEHALQATEGLAAIANLTSAYEYPVQPLHECWTLMCLNTDRNTIWGSAGGMVFVNDKSWDVQDRFDWIQQTAGRELQSSGRASLSAGQDIGLFNFLNWSRNDPVVLELPAGHSLDEGTCEATENGKVLCEVEMPSAGIGGWRLSTKPPASPQSVPPRETIDTEYYAARFDLKTGAIVSLKLKKSGKELLAGPANVVVAERPTIKQKDDPGDKMPPRPGRTRLASSSDQQSAIEIKEGPLSITVEAVGSFYGGGRLMRRVRFYRNHPRIDFETELNDIPNYTVVVAEFPLAGEIASVRRGIPYGFSHGAWARPDPNLHGWTKGIVPTVRWIDLEFVDGGGFAILDRGLTGRELNDRTPILYLLNAEDRYVGYDNPWLSGKGQHLLPYSIVAHDSPWESARIPQMAWEYNCQPFAIPGCSAGHPKSLLSTSENVIVEAFRREANYIEIRMVECFGAAGTAEISLKLPHRSAALTDLVGRSLSPLPPSESYKFPVRPQQIVTMHFEVSSSLQELLPVKSWDSFVPRDKLAALHAYDPSLIGHPPFGEQ